MQDRCAIWCLGGNDLTVGRATKSQRLALGRQGWKTICTPLKGATIGRASRTEVVAEQFGRDLLAAVDPVAAGFVVYPARALAVESSAGATDFGLYFIYFSLMEPFIN